MDTTPTPSNSLERYYHIDGDQLERHYKEHRSHCGGYRLRRGDQGVGQIVGVTEAKAEDTLRGISRPETGLFIDPLPEDDLQQKQHQGRSKALPGQMVQQGGRQRIQVI